jgi:GDPmannose 4,6-dehydratase
LNTGRIDHIYQDPHVIGKRLFLHYGDLTDIDSLQSILQMAKPQEIFNLGAQSHVKVSYDVPIYTSDVIVQGTLSLLEATRTVCPKASFYQASSSEMFGTNTEIPQNEESAFMPASPYAVAKLAAHNFAKLYREAYNMFVCCGILYNHESERRGETFVTRKITRAATRIKVGLQDKLYLGNLDAKRDWGLASEYVNAIFMMLQHVEPDDYVVATGETHTVREFAELAFKRLDMNFEKYVDIDVKYLRPVEVPLLCGDASKIKRVLGWEPKVKFEELIKIMVDADMRLALKEKAASEAGND